MKIYVAGASREVHSIVSYMAELRRAGYEITHDWTRDVLEYQEARKAGLPASAITGQKRLECALLDAEGVLQCDVLWVVCPRSDSHSVGCWTELGIAIGASGCGRTKRVVVSGDWARSEHTEFISTELADQRFETHERALGYLCSLHNVIADPTKGE
jgi:hypothetical protein